MKAYLESLGMAVGMAGSLEEDDIRVDGAIEAARRACHSLVGLPGPSGIGCERRRYLAETL